VIPRLVLDSVLEPFYAGHLGAARATEESAVALQTVPNDFAPAMRALWRHCMNGALEGIEDVRLAFHGDRERFVVIVAADFALRHWAPALRSGQVYGESSAAGTAILPENFPHLGIRIAGEAECEPRQIGDELIIALRVHFVLDDVGSARDLSLQMFYPLFCEVGHIGGPEAMARK